MKPLPLHPRRPPVRLPPQPSALWLLSRMLAGLPSRVVVALAGMPSAASCPSTPTRSQRPWQRSRPSRDHRRGLDSPSLSLPRPLLPGGTRVSSRPRPPGPPQLPHPPKLPLPTVPFSLSNCGPSISDPLAHFWLFSFFSDPFDFFGSTAPSTAPATKAQQPQQSKSSSSDFSFDAFDQPPAAAKPAQPQQKTPTSSGDIDFSFFDAPKPASQPSQPPAQQFHDTKPIEVRESSKPTEPEGKKTRVVEVLQDEDPFPDEDEDLAYEHVEPSSAPPPSRSTHVEEPPKRGGSERRPETRSSPAAQPRHDDEYGYAHGDGGSDPRGAKGASAGSGSGGAGAGGGFGFGNTGALFGKVMGGVSIVSEKATKLGKEAVKVASEKSSQVKQFVNQTLLEESTGPRVRRENVKELMDMGFSEDDSTCALYVARNDVFDALDILKSTEKLNEARHAYRKAASAPRSQGEQGSGEGQRASHPSQQQPSQPSQQTQQQQRSRSQTPNAAAAQKSAAQKFDDMVDQMTGMGYTLNDAYDSLAVTNDVEKAIEILTKKGVKPERRSQAAPPQQQPPQQQPQRAPRQASSQPTQAAARTQQQPSQQPQQQPVSRTATPSAKEAAAKFDEMVDSLMAMGFTMGDAYDALATTNDFDKAVEFLQKKNQPEKVPAHRTQASQPSQPSQSQSQPQPQQQRPQSQNQPSQARPQQSPPSSGEPTPKAPSPKPATPKVVDAPPLAPQVEQQVAAIKEKGNAFFKAGDFASARGHFFFPPSHFLLCMFLVSSFNLLPSSAAFRCVQRGPEVDSGGASGLGSPPEQPWCLLPQDGFV